MAVLKMAVLGIVTAIVCRYLLVFIALSDFYKVPHNHEPGKCLYVPDIYHGSEDVQLTDDGVAIITTGLNWVRKYSADRKHAPGQLKVVDLEAAIKSGGAPASKTLALPAGFDASTFNPHGMSAWPVRSDAKQSSGDTAGKPQKLYNIFVVNHVHNSSTDAIEVFEFDVTSQKITRHIRSISDPGIKHANNIAAVGKDRFFFTNDLSAPTDTLRQLEIYAQLPTGSVGYYNGHNVTLVAHGLMLPNGIALSHDYKHLYVIESNRKSLNIYYVSSSGSSNAAAVPTLRWVATHHFGSIGDNVLVDADGDLWIAAHPVGWKLLQFLGDPLHRRAPSQVLRLKLPANPSAQPFTSEIYADDGTKLSGSAVALYYKKHVLIGTINDKAMWCECAIEQCLIKGEVAVGRGGADETKKLPPMPVK